MFSIRKIVRKNRETYYNFSTKRLQPIWPLIVGELAVSVILLVLFSSVTGSFLQAVLTVYSILIGFSFSVLFFLVSIRKMEALDEDPSVELTLRLERINRLRDELFYNVSYFSCGAIAVVLLTLGFFVTAGLNSSLIGWATIVISTVELHEFWLFVAAAIGSGAIYIYKLLFYFLLVDSMFSFARIITRVSYFFEQKISNEL